MVSCFANSAPSRLRLLFAIDSLHPSTKMRAAKYPGAVQGKQYKIPLKMQRASHPARGVGLSSGSRAGCGAGSQLPFTNPGDLRQERTKTKLCLILTQPTAAFQGISTCSEVPAAAPASPRSTEGGVPHSSRDRPQISQSLSCPTLSSSDLE